MNAAATYARSSKDRSDISIATQQRELGELARARDLQVVREFADAVQSGSTDDRPAFRDLIAALKDRGRGWSHLLVLDTSRLARGRFIAQAFKRECARHGVTILYAKFPETDPVSTVILEAVFEAMDEVHSLMSREKGLAGMAENVRQGFRAGGRAPFGYRLKYISTGTVRDGKPVMKSRLELAPGADGLRDFLQMRARGVAREIARRRAGGTLNTHSLIGIEWNALTYAGHTVWNRHRELDRHGNRTGTKLRPRAEWRIHRDTHPALITDAEAEGILHALETSPVSKACQRSRALASNFLLTGLLETAAGRAWIGNGGQYRLRARSGEKGHCVRAKWADWKVRTELHRELASDVFVARYADEIRARLSAGPSLDLRQEIHRLERERRRASELAIAGEDGEAFAELVQARTRQIEELQRELRASAPIRPTATIADLRAWMTSRPEQELLQDLVERIVLEPGSTCIRIEWRAPQRSKTGGH